jgi:Short C-terminal domain/Protein of unknown function (DUF3592)
LGYGPNDGEKCAVAKSVNYATTLIIVKAILHAKPVSIKSSKGEHMFNAIDPTSLICVVIPIFLILALFLIFGVPALIRRNIKATGELANATILDVNCGYSRGRYSGEFLDQNITLKLEVHPTNGIIFTTKDRFKAEGKYIMNLRAGNTIQVKVSKANPKKVVSLPETAPAFASMSKEGLRGIGMSSLAALTERGGAAGQRATAILEVLEKQGISSQSVGIVNDPKVELEKLKEMLISGLITQSEFDNKKAEILSRM